MRSTFQIVDFAFDNLHGWPTGTPTRGVLHTDGNPRPHSALAALIWGNRERAFTIQWYVEGSKAYRGVKETWHASHAKRADIAQQEGYRTTWPGLSAPRGDIKAVGIEHVMEADGSWSQETRITSVLLGAKIWKRWPNLRWSEHAHWDPWNRPFDVGDALYVPDWVLDVKDVIAGKEPWRTVQVTASSTPAPKTGPTPSDPGAPPDGQGEPSERRLATLEAKLGILENRLDTIIEHITTQQQRLIDQNIRLETQTQRSDQIQRHLLAAGQSVMRETRP